LSGCNIQYDLLYYPSASVPSEEVLSAHNLRFWPSSVMDYRGLAGTNEMGGAKGTVIVFHGNGGTAVDRDFYVKALGALGYRVILAEYPGYGGRKGDLGEESFVSDAGETVRLAFEKYGGPIFLLGESLGCGVAAAAGDRAVKIDGLVLITPWDTLLSVAKSHFPFLPVKLFLKDKYDNIGNLKSFEGRIAVVGAGRDRVIPVRHANDLYDSLPSTAKKMWTLKAAGHNDWPGFMDMALWKEIMDFVSLNDSSLFSNEIGRK
ncbi:MAG TPA: alpha/beta fold hydrolase, partial [Geobacteraceae bacterium]|nr:alpha/beta fold hydrolase [Geobacteraceae bacterium]